MVKIPKKSKKTAICDTESLLKESEERYRTMIENSNDVIWVLDKEGNYAYVNPAAERVSGIKKEDFMGKSYEPMIPPDDLSRIKKIFQDTLSGKKTHYEVIVPRQKGKPLMLSVNTAPQYEFGRIVGTVSFGRDITEEKEAEAKLRFQSEIMKNLDEGVCLIRSKDGVIIYTNAKFERIFGYNLGEMMGKHISSIYAPGEKYPEEVAEEIINLSKRRGEWQGDVSCVKKNGIASWCHANASAFSYPGYDDVLVLIYTDITDKKKLEEAPEQLKKEIKKTTEELERTRETSDSRYKRLVEQEIEIIRLEKKIKEMAEGLNGGEK